MILPRPLPNPAASMLSALFPHFPPPALLILRMPPVPASLHGRVVPTYESCSTKNYFHGRTEVIRSAHQAGADFCRAVATRGTAVRPGYTPVSRQEQVPAGAFLSCISCCGAAIACSGAVWGAMMCSVIVWCVQAGLLKAAVQRQIELSKLAVAGQGAGTRNARTRHAGAFCFSPPASPSLTSLPLSCFLSFFPPLSL